MFTEKKSDLQLVIFNQGDETVQDASLILLMPNHDAFHVATQLPKTPKDNQYIDRTPAEQADYPSVSLRDDSIQISVKLDSIPPGEPINIFTLPLRLCAGDELKGRRLGIQYTLFAQNLRAPAKGKLRLILD